MPDIEKLPSYAELCEREDAPKGSSWGLFGEDDQLGTLNLLTPERVAAAASPEPRIRARSRSLW